MSTTISLQKELLVGAEIDDRWFKGPFAQLKLLPAKAKGKRFEQIATQIFEQKQMKVQKSVNTDHDRIVDGVKIEIKGSTVTKDSDDRFSFLQIRPAQDYDFLVLETFWFDGTIKFYRISKQEIIELIEKRVFVPQHGGNNGKSGTFCYNGSLDCFEDYFWFEVKVNG